MTRPRNRTGRRMRCPALPTPPDTVDCVAIVVPVPLLPFMRMLFQRTYQRGLWEREEDYERAVSYFSQIEAEMFLCSGTGAEVIENQNKNQCSLMAFLVSILSQPLGLPIDPATALTLCEIIRAGVGAISGSPEDVAARATLLDVQDLGIGMNTNQLEGYQKVIAELIGGVGVVPGVD